MPTIIAPATILVKNHGHNPIDIGNSPFKLLMPVSEMVFTELHMNENGTIHGTPTFAIVFDKWDTETNTGIRYVAQVSIEKLQTALAELGYTLYQP